MCISIYVRVPQLPLRTAGFACRKIRLGIARFGSTSGFHPNPNPLSTSQPPPLPSGGIWILCLFVGPSSAGWCVCCCFFPPKKKETRRGA